MPESSPRVTAVCIVHRHLPDPDNPDRLTAIDKQPIHTRVEVSALALAGDATHHPGHGGVDAPVYAYADEDAAWWAADLDREIPPGLFGENLRTAGIDLTGAQIGERWRVGGHGLVLEVASPRIPCATFQRRMDVEHWVKRFTDHGAPGAYLRTFHPGSVGAGDRVVVEHRPGHGVTIADAFLRPEPATMQRLLDAEHDGLLVLAGNLRRRAEKAAARA
jgi:MOSC domain-containing protein YiiM